MTHLENMTEHIAQMNSWLFNGDMVDTPLHDKAEAAQHYANAERARKSAQLYALAAIAESLARIASTVGDEELLSGRSIAVLRAVNPFQY